MIKNTTIFILSVIFILGISTGAYFYFQSDLQIGQPKLPPTEIPSPKLTSTPTPTTMSIKEVPEDWEIYTSQEHEFQIAHPPEIKIISGPQGEIRFSLSGPNQQERTVLTDGFSIIVSSNGYTSSSLLDLVKKTKTKISKNPATSNFSEIKQKVIDGKSAYYFKLHWGGENTYYFLDKGNKKHLEIIKIVQDPTGQGFEQTVDQMLSTLTLI